MMATLLEATEMIGLPILLVSGFVLVVVLALLMVFLRKEKTYEDIVRERERKLGDLPEGLFVFILGAVQMNAKAKLDTPSLCHAFLIIL